MNDAEKELADLKAKVAFMYRYRDNLADHLREELLKINYPNLDHDTISERGYLAGLNYALRILTRKSKIIEFEDAKMNLPIREEKEAFA